MTVVKCLVGMDGLTRSSGQYTQVREVQTASSHPLRLVLEPGSFKELTQNCLGSSLGSPTTCLGFRVWILNVLQDSEVTV